MWECLVQGLEAAYLQNRFDPLDEYDIPAHKLPVCILVRTNFMFHNLLLQTHDLVCFGGSKDVFICWAQVPNQASTKVVSDSPFTPELKKCILPTFQKAIV